MKEKPFLLRMEPDIHKALKVYCAEKGESMQDFIMKAIEKQAAQKIFTPERTAV